MSRPRILMLAHLIPWPLEGGGQIKSYHTLQGLSEAYDVRMLVFYRREGEQENIRPLEMLCTAGIEPIRLPRTKISNALAALSSLLQNRSFIIERDAAPEMKRRVAEELRSGNYSLLYVDHLQMMQFVPENTGQARVVLENHNIEYRIPQRIAETPGSGAKARFTRWYAAQEWPKLREFERDAIRKSHLTIAVSQADAEGLAELAPERAKDILGIPIGVDTDYFAMAKRNPASRTLLSIGTMYWPPNIDSMLYFCRDIFPIIKVQLPGIRLNIVGANPVPEILALGQTDPAIHVTGKVPDVRPYAEDCGVFIVPLRSGSGMRVKILNALSMGLPVVSTTVGAEGIDVTHGREILLADTPESFATAVLELLRNPERATALGQAGRQLMLTRYSYQAVGEQLRTVLAERFGFPTGTVKPTKAEAQRG